MIDDHPYLGTEAEFEDGDRVIVGKITGVKYAGILTAGHSKRDLRISGKAIKVRIKPHDGSRARWVGPLKDVPR